MNKTKIDWADYSWNPIKGACPEACWYCYARRIYERFKLDPKPALASEKELFSPVNSWRRRRDKARIFVCSTFELFHPAADALRESIFQVIEMDVADTFIILTKRPERVDRPMPPNVWLGVSVTGLEDWYRVRELSKIPARVKIVSLEPFIGKVPTIGPRREFDWLIVGRLTGRGEKRDPDPGDIFHLYSQARKLDIPIFMKDNLRDVYPTRLIQEWPKCA